MLFSQLIKMSAAFEGVCLDLTTTILKCSLTDIRYNTSFSLNGILTTESLWHLKEMTQKSRAVFN